MNFLTKDQRTFWRSASSASSFKRFSQRLEKPEIFEESLITLKLKAYLRSRFLPFNFILFFPCFCSLSPFLCTHRSPVALMQKEQRVGWGGLKWQCSHIQIPDVMPQSFKFYAFVITLIIFFIRFVSVLRERYLIG